MMQKLSVGVISLGCDKNRVDTEKMLAILSNDYLITPDPLQADIIIINTCAFLQSAREEAIGEILDVAQLKKGRPDLKLIVTGCLPQKFVDELYPELLEVDAFLGVSDYLELPRVISMVLDGQRVNAVGEPREECGKKRFLTTDHYAYLKIADGCSNHCTYCLIPSIRGKFRSVPVDSLIEEVKGLGEVKELILVAQDVTKYGHDLGDGQTLVSLIRKLSNLTTVGSIRLLYCYPEGITDELIEELKTNDKLIKYLDIPLQHADDVILKRMNRKGTGQGYLELISKLKEQIPSIALRSTFITGFPGETQQAFDNLVNFLQSAKLFNAGFFAYSREEGTPAYKLPDQIDKKTKNSRLRKLYSVQKAVVKRNLKELVGKTVRVIVEGFDDDTFTYFGRAYFNAPNVDGKIYFFSGDQVDYGNYYDVLITKADGYDLYGERI